MYVCIEGGDLDVQDEFQAIKVETGKLCCVFEGELGNRGKRQNMTVICKEA